MPYSRWFVFVLLVLTINPSAKLSAQEIFAGPKFDSRPLSLTNESGLKSRPTTVVDLVTRRRFLGASISPNGRFFSYAAVRANIANNNYQTVLALAETRDPSRIRVLGTAGSPRWNYVGEFFQEAPQWSPDGKYVTYTVQNRGVRQIWRWAVGEGSGEQLTHSKLDVLNYRWLPNGLGIIYSTKSNSSGADDLDTSDPILFEETTMGNYGLPLLDRDRVSSPKTKLWIYDVRRRSSRAATDMEIKPFADIFKSPFRSAGKKDPRLSNDGRLLADVDSVPNEDKNTSDINHLVFKEVSTEKVVMKSDSLPTVPTVATWKPDNKTVLVYWGQVFGTQGLYKTWLEDGKLRPVLESFSEFLTSCSFTEKVDKALCFDESPIKVRSLVLVDLQSHEMKTVADINPEFQSLQLAKPIVMSWTNKYGDAKQGWVILPVDYVEGRRYPAIITSYYFPGSFLNGNGDEFPLQTFASNGFVVICVHTPPERRRDRGFENAILDWASPTASFEEIIRILDQKGIVDRQNVGIAGLSYGAELTEYAVSHSGVFAAAASTSAGSHEPSNMYTLDRAAKNFYFGQGMGLLGWWEGDIYAKNWSRYSTHLNATRIRSPWLIQSADREFTGAVGLFNRLRELNKPIELWVYPNEFHVKNQPRHQFIAQERYLDWFNFWLQNKEDPDPAKADQYKRWRELKKL